MSELAQSMLRERKDGSALMASKKAKVFTGQGLLRVRLVSRVACRGAGGRKGGRSAIRNGAEHCWSRLQSRYLAQCNDGIPDNLHSSSFLSRVNCQALQPREVRLEPHNGSPQREFAQACGHAGPLAQVGRGLRHVCQRAVHPQGAQLWRYFGQAVEREGAGVVCSMGRRCASRSRTP